MADRSSSERRGEDSSGLPTTTGPQQDDSVNRQRSFVFVDSTAESSRSREAIRVHVMRESHRSRREALGQPTSSASRGELQIWDAGSSSSESASQASQSRRGSRQDSTAMVAPRRRVVPSLSADIIPTEAATSTEPSAPSSGERSSAQPSSPGISPMTALGGGRRDPFAQFPARQTDEVDVLIDHYASQMAYLSYELLPLYRDDTVSFHALLAFAAVHRLNQTALTSPSRAAQYEGRALMVLKERVDEGSTAQSNGTILAVGVMANLEESRGNNEAARIHWNALKNMIQERDGLQALWNHRMLHSAVLRLDVSICTSAVSSLQQPYVTSHHGSLSCSVTLAEDTRGTRQALPDGTTLAEAREIVHAGEEFIEFVTSVRSQIQQTASRPPDRAEFQLPPLLVDILNAPSQRQINLVGQRIRSCTHLACLTFLSAAVMEYSTDQASTSELMDNLQKVVLDRVTRHHVCSQELLYFLFQGVESRPEAQTPDRVWKVSRLMSVAKKLSEPWWQQVCQHLLLYLGVADDAEDDIQEALQWDTEDVRREIYGQLFPLWTTLR